MLPLNEMNELNKFLFHIEKLFLTCPYPDTSVNKKWKLRIYVIISEQNRSEFNLHTALEVPLNFLRVLYRINLSRYSV